MNMKNFVNFILATSSESLDICIDAFNVQYMIVDY